MGIFFNKIPPLSRPSKKSRRDRYVTTTAITFASVIPDKTNLTCNYEAKHNSCQVELFIMPSIDLHIQGISFFLDFYMYRIDKARLTLIARKLYTQYPRKRTPAPLVFPSPCSHAHTS